METLRYVTYRIPKIQLGPPGWSRILSSSYSSSLYHLCKVPFAMQGNIFIYLHVLRIRMWKSLRGNVLFCLPQEIIILVRVSKGNSRITSEASELSSEDGSTTLGHCLHPCSINAAPGIVQSAELPEIERVIQRGLLQPSKLQFVVLKISFFLFLFFFCNSN